MSRAQHQISFAGVPGGTVMTMTMPKILSERHDGYASAKVLRGQDRATNAKFWRQIAVSPY